MDVQHINGYDSSAPNYDQLTVSDLGRNIIRSAVVLCHEVAHAIAYFEVQSYTEPRFNNEPFAEIGHAFENYVFGGTLGVRESRGGLWIRQWPALGRMNGYTTRVFPRGIYASTLQPGDQWLDEAMYVRFLNDQFWDTETAAPGSRRCKPFKKSWLRPYHEVPKTPQEYNSFTTGHMEAPLRGNQAKRRRLAGTRLAGTTREECPRWEDKRRTMQSTIEKSSRVQLVRRKEKKEKRKERFHEREQLRLNQVWVDMLRQLPRNPL